MQTTLNRILAVGAGTRPRLTVHLPPALVRAAIVFCLIAPVAMRLLWLRWLAADMGATHPCMHEITTEIAELEAARRQGVRTAWRVFAWQLRVGALRWL